MPRWLHPKNQDFDGELSGGRLEQLTWVRKRSLPSTRQKNTHLQRVGIKLGLKLFIECDSIPPNILLIYLMQFRLYFW